MRVLAITKIFPNSLEPLSSPFNRQQFTELAKLCDLTVCEAIPHVPLARYVGLPPRAAKLARLPTREDVAGIPTHFVRQLYLPAIGTSVALPLYLASLAPYAELARKADVVFGTWGYPDGCAATLFARALGKPCVVKVHGSDVNVLGKRKTVRACMRAVLPRASSVVAVSRALADELALIGVPREKIVVVPNGVDTSLFRPQDRAAARQRLGLPLDRRIVLFCGRLEPQKGVADLLDAFAKVRAQLPDATLALVGDGVLRERVTTLRAQWYEALVAPGARPHAEIADWLAACDLFTLPSHAEGTPNVVLEAIAAGRPTVATRVGGIPDVLPAASGILVPPRDPDALARALVLGLERSWEVDDVVRASPGSWAESAAKLARVLEGAINESDRDAAPPPSPMAA